MNFDPISAVADLINKGLDKFVADKMPEADREKLKNEMIQFAITQTTAQNSAFRDFVIRYEGSAKDNPRFINILRSLIRPLFTILVGYLDYQFFTSTTFTPEQAELLKAVNVIILFFWFGERAVTNSGIVDKLVGRKK